MPSRSPSDWMWAQACELIDQAERMHRQFFRLAASPQTHAVWEPPIDVLEDEREVVVVLALPGVPAERVEISVESGSLVIRAQRPIPFAGSSHVVRRLEIPYGHFERSIALSEALEAATHEMVDGCLVLRLRKAGWTEHS